jgi:hypothetical protein
MTMATPTTPPEGARTTDPRAQPGRPDQSCWLPEFDKFSREPAEKDDVPDDVTHPPDIEPISGPVHREERIEESALVL